MNSLDADGVVLGAGLAGMLLAERLASRGARGRVVLIEPRHDYGNDQTWSFWRLQPHRWEEQVERSWESFSWSSAGWRQTLSSRRYRYQAIPSRALFDRALAAVEQAPGLELRRGVSATSVRERADGVEVVTSEGIVRAEWVVDTRPQGAPAGALVQRFVGARIRTGAASFDPHRVGLMEEMQVDQHGFRFVYLLPYAPDEALVEVTRFATGPLPAGLLDAEVNAACDRLALGGWQTVRSERGAIPMALPDRPAVRSRVVQAGRRGGGARPSTGYAFLRIDRWAERAAAAIVAGGPPPGHPADPPVRRALDRIFLRVLATRPDLAPTVFLSLAANAPADRLVRFLSDASGPLDVAAVVASLPPLPFLGALLEERPAPQIAEVPA